MAKQLNTVCNMCGVTLYGKHGIEQVQAPYIYIHGRIALQNQGEGTRKYHTFVTRDDEEETTVCDVKCLGDYLNLRKNEYKRIREEKLRAEAGSGRYGYG